VITKVHARTEAGLRQYVRRALDDGASPTEILDALLMAFPALGLSKIVWAVDVLLKSDIAEFRAESRGAAPAWREVGEVKRFAAGVATRIECDGRALFVYRSGRTFRVYDSHCPHQRTNIPLDALSGRELKCPKHGWTFDVASGACISIGTRPLTRYRSKTERGVLYAYW
jgi:nitrite reductase/ring-hydroxylating ferredoxin subunit